MWTSTSWRVQTVLLSPSWLVVTSAPLTQTGPTLCRYGCPFCFSFPLSNMNYKGVLIVISYNREMIHSFINSGQQSLSLGHRYLWIWSYPACKSWRKWLIYKTLPFFFFFFPQNYLECIGDLIFIFHSWILVKGTSMFPPPSRQSIPPISTPVISAKTTFCQKRTQRPPVSTKDQKSQSQLAELTAFLWWRKQSTRHQLVDL